MRIFLSVFPVQRIEDQGAIPLTDDLRQRLAETENGDRRALGWEMARASAERAREAGCNGVILMGLAFSTLVSEASEVWHP